MNNIHAPNFTQIPNVVFDYWMNVLSPAEFKVLLCLCRKTFGYHKLSDLVSLSQIEELTGLSRKGIIKNIKSLINHNLIKKTKSKSESKKGVYETNSYQIHVHSVEEGRELSTPGGRELSTPGVVNSDSKCSELSTHTKETSTKEREIKNIAQTRKIRSEQRADFSFSSSSGKFEGITEKDKVEWKIAYPAIDMERETIKAEQWLKANPSKAKKKLWRKFLFGWFSRANDKAENQAAYRSNTGNSIEDSKFRSWEKDSPEDDWVPQYGFNAPDTKY